MKQRLLRLAISCFGVICGLASSEIYLRLAGPDWLFHRMRALNAGEHGSFGNDAGWPVERDEAGRFLSFRPGSRFAVRHYEYSNVASVDELGGRINPSTPGASEIVPFLGDSFLFGVGVEDDQTFSHLLALRANRRYVNLGVPGTALPDHLDILERRFASLGSPRVVVLFVAIANDLEDVLQYNRYSRSSRGGRAGKKHGPDWYVNRYVFHNAIAKRSFLVQWIKSKLLTLFSRIQADRDPFFLLIHDDSHLEARVRPFAKEMERLRQMANDRGFRAKIVLVPSVFQVSRPRFDHIKDYYGVSEHLDLNAPNEALRSIAGVLELDLLDPLECLRDQPVAEALYYELDNHLTVAGNAAFAECLARENFDAWLEQ